jgi:hypothetical protein
MMDVLQDEEGDESDKGVVTLRCWLQPQPLNRMTQNESSYRSEVIMVGFALNDELSMDRIPFFLSEINACGKSGVRIVFVGLKSDVETISDAKVMQKLRSFYSGGDFDYFKTSAKSGRNVRKLFLHVIRMSMQKDEPNRPTRRKQIEGAAKEKQIDWDAMDNTDSKKKCTIS